PFLEHRAAEIEPPYWCLPFAPDVFQVQNAVVLDPTVRIFRSGEQHRLRRPFDSLVETRDEQRTAAPRQVRHEYAVIASRGDAEQRTRRIPPDPIRDQPFLG